MPILKDDLRASPESRSSDAPQRPETVQPVGISKTLVFALATLLWIGGGSVGAVAVFSLVKDANVVGHERPVKASEGLLARSPVHRFGKTRQGEKLTHVFELTNAGNELCFVAGVRTTCACSVVSFKPRHVAPGATLEIPVTLRTGRADGLTGATCDVVYYVHGDDTERRCELRVQAEVVPDVAVSPREITFVAGRRDVAVIHFRAEAISAFELLDVTTDHPAFSATIPSSGPRSAIVEVSFDPSRWTGLSRLNYVRVRTSSEHQVQFDLPIRVFPPPAS